MSDRFVMDTPTVTEVAARSIREVTAKLTPGEPIHTGDQGIFHTPQRFLPDTLMLSWTDGRLTTARLSGVRLRGDDQPFLDGLSDSVSFIDPTRRELASGRYARWGLAADAPAWVRALVEKYQP